MDVYNFNPNHFSLDLSIEEITIYSLVVYSKAFKMDIKLVIAVFYKGGVTIIRHVLRLNFCIGMQSSLLGLTNCQERSRNKLNFHFNAALKAVNLAKQDWSETKGNVDKPFSNPIIMYNNNLMLERFMCMFALNPNTPKNQNIFKELLDYGEIAA